LRRPDWDQGAQALRPSLNEILDVYIGSRIPPEYADLKIVICLCFGGDVDQGVEAELRGFIERSTTDRVSFEEWNGDKLAGLILTGALGPGLLPNEALTSFRKSIAMVDEPEASYSYFCDLIRQVVSNCGDTQKEKVRVARQVNICLWVLYVWSRDAGNIESSYRSSEFSVLHLWGMGSSFITENGAQPKAMLDALQNVLNLHLRICKDYAFDRILPLASTLHGLSSAVRASESLDVNLKLFDVIGRASLCGFWLNHLAGIIEESGEGAQESLEAGIRQLADGVSDAVVNNPALFTPIQDQHAIDINIACIFLYSQGRSDVVALWISQIERASIYSYRTNSKYPCILGEYRELLEHPRSPSQEYRQEVTAGSVLYPTLAFWATITGQHKTLESLSAFCREELGHCTLQLWFPDEDSEERLYSNSGIHGVALTGIEITPDGGSLMESIKRECEQNSHFEELSAVRLGQLPLVLAACRHYRLPLPPHIWLQFLPASEPSDEPSDSPTQ
jgi:hypothetical protein